VTSESVLVFLHVAAAFLFVTGLMQASVPFERITVIPFSMWSR
jgi:hypothetical protein